jgi:zinc protease
MKALSWRVFLGLLAGCSVFLAQGAQGGKSELPSAQEVLERYTKEIGGKSSVKRYKSQHVVGTVELPAQKISGKLEIFAARPNKLLMKVSFPALGDVTTAFNGEVGWMSTAITGPMLMEGKMLEEVTTQADFDHVLHDPSDYKSMETLAKEEFNGEECYKLKLVYRTGFESTEFFSVKSGLQTGYIATQETQFGPVASTTLLSDYRKFGDVLTFGRMVQKASGIETVSTIEEVEYDKVDPAVFNLPPEVKTLIEQKKKESEKPQAEKKKA